MTRRGMLRRRARRVTRAVRAARATVPPLGAVGLMFQTPAAQATFRMPANLAQVGIRLRRRKRRKRKIKKAIRRHARRVRRGRAHLVKGSLAAKRHMARLRKLRKRMG